AIGGVCLFFIKKQKAALFAGLLGACLLIVSFCNNEWMQLHQCRLVVYNMAKTDHIELINGKAYSILCTDTTPAKKLMYVTNPAHIRWAAWHQRLREPAGLFDINGKTILLLNRGVD